VSRRALVPNETLANALGAERLASELRQRGDEVVRTGSFGLAWLEPMLVIDGEAYGPVQDLDALDAVALGMDVPNYGPATIQERAYTSPIWYRPPAQ